MCVEMKILRFGGDVSNSFELHSPLNQGNPHKKWHWQLNRWNKNKVKAINHWRIWGEQSINEKNIQ